MECLISFSDFLYAFQVQFCYDGMTNKLSAMKNSHDQVKLNAELFKAVKKLKRI